MCEEDRVLSVLERQVRSMCQERLCLAINERAAVWRQRGKRRAVREGDSNPTASRSTRPNNHKLARMNWGVRVWDPNLLLLGDLLLELVAKDRTTVPALQEKLCEVTRCGDGGGGGPRSGSSEWFG